MKDVVSDPSSISINTTHVLSDTKITCQTNISGDKYVIILNPRNPSEKVQLKMNADNFSVHPSQNLLAVRGGKSIQVFDLDSNKRINKCTFSDSIDYMTWIDDTHIAVITKKSVYHFDITKEDSSKQIFERTSSLNDSIIVRYQVDKSGSWCLVHGTVFDV